MQDYDDYPEDSVEWWENQEAIVYGKEIEKFEWDEVDDEQAE
jgi:hypothetical protein